MRAVVVGPAAKWSTADVWRGWCRGLADNGVEVIPYELADRFMYFKNAVWAEDGKVIKQMDVPEAILAASQDICSFLYRYQADVLFVIHGADVDWRLLAEVRCPVVLVMTESPYEDEAQALMAQAVEPALILLNDPTHDGVFEQIAPTLYMPHAYDPAVHHPGNARRSGVVFVATGFQNRCDFLAKVDWSGIDLELGGEWSRLDGTDLARFVVHDNLADCVNNAVTAEMYRRAAAGMNVYRYTADGEHSTADGWAAGPREIEMAACGLWFCRQPRPESDELFPMLPTFETPGELGDLLRWAVAHPDETEQAAAAAMVAVADRTFTNHARRALAHLDL